MFYLFLKKFEQIFAHKSSLLFICLQKGLLATVVCAVAASFMVKNSYELPHSLPFNEAHATVLPLQESQNLLLEPTQTQTVTEWHSKIDSLKQKKRVTAWIANRFKIEESSANLFVSAAYRTGFELGLDPHLILSVIAIESRFDPTAESRMGAQGLMQVLSKMHAQRFKQYGGVHLAFDPEINIRVGSEILKVFLKQTGSVEKALKSYVGSAAMSHDGGYGSKVLTEYHLLKLVASGHHLDGKVPGKGKGVLA